MTTPSKKRSVPFCRPSIGEEEIAEVVDALRSGWISSGPKVVEFEKQIKERLGCEHAIAVNSGTAALHLAIACLDLQPGDEVIVPTLTWPATSNVVELCGAKTVFCDVDPETLCIDVDDAAARITERTRAIMPVHFAGQPADLTRLRELAAKHSLRIIEDAAHAIGTRYRDGEIGSDSELAIFSFHAIKNLTTGEGGMVLCRDPKLAARIRLLRFHGVSKDAWKEHGRGAGHYELIEPGWKYNMTDIMAAIGLQQLRKLDGFIERRRELAERYLAALETIPELSPLKTVAWPAKHAWHLFIVAIDEEAAGMKRGQLITGLAEAGVGAGFHFPPVHELRYYRERYGYQPGALPAAEDIGQRILSLPLFPGLSNEDQDFVIATLKSVIAQARPQS